MNRIVGEWIEKAEGDFRTAAREFSAESQPNFDAACYHAQQCAEKLMKALLIQRGITPPRTHHLVVLDELLRAAVPEWSYPLPDIRILSLAAVQFRYPGSSATRQDAQQALTISEAMRTILLDLLHQHDR